MISWIGNYSPLALTLTAALTVASMVAAGHALMTKREPRAALAWVAFCLVLPGIGPAVYVIFGINRVYTRARRTYRGHLEEDGREYFREPPGTALRPLSQVGEKLTGRGLVSVADLTLLRDGEDFYPRLLRDIAAAGQSVYCSTYILRGDGTGARFIDALAAAQGRGVDVRLIVDGLGELAYWPRCGKLLREAGIHFRYFNPVTLLPPTLRVNMRCHRKLAIIDDRIGYAGGQNISDKHLARRAGGGIHDLHFRFTGKLVDDLRQAFLQDWGYCRGEQGSIPYDAANELRPDAGHWTRLILDGPQEPRDTLSDLLVGIISAARRRVWIMTPYFLPDMDLAGALTGACLRGVDVKIVLPQRTNIVLTQWAMGHGLRHILDRGLAVYRQPPPFNHAKAIVIDDRYALIGSANIDPRSLRLNFELGVEIFSATANAQLAGYFEECLGRSVALELADLDRRRPWQKLRDAMAWLLSPYL